MLRKSISNDIQWETTTQFGSKMCHLCSSKAPQQSENSHYRIRNHAQTTTATTTRTWKKSTAIVEIPKPGYNSASEMSDDSKSRGVAADQQSQYHYGTFQGVANYYPPPPPPVSQPPPQPVVGFPQPVPPIGATAHPSYPHHYVGYQTVTGTLNDLSHSLSD